MSDAHDWTWLEKVLEGIDRDASEPFGWWETSVGVEFGKNMMSELKTEILRRYVRIDEDGPT